MPFLNFLQGVAGALTRLNPEAEQQRMERQKMSDMLKERLFNENATNQRLGMEQKRLQGEQQNWDAEQKQRQATAQRQSIQDQASFEQNPAFRPANTTPPQDIAGPEGNSGIMTPSDIGNPNLIKLPTGQSFMPRTPEELGDLATAGAQRQARAKQAASTEEMNARLGEASKFDPDFKNKYKDQIAQSIFNGGKTFTQPKQTDPMKSLMQQYNDETDPEKQKALLEKITDISKAKSAKTLKQGELDSANRDPKNFFNSGVDQGTIDANATRYNMTGGEMPSLGMSGNPAARAAIMVRAHEQDPEADLATNKVAYKSNSSTIGKQLSAYDNLMSYENTAKANLKTFMDLVDKVPDAGSPWINKPLRQVEERGLGSEDVAAFHAAQDVAKNEIAQILNNRGMSSVLSQKARDEVKSLLGPDMSAGQLHSVAKILYSDMENSKVARESQIHDSYERMKKGGKGLGDVGESASPMPNSKPTAAPAAAAAPPPRPASIPANARAQYSPNRKQWRYTTDDGKTWQIVP